MDTSLTPDLSSAIANLGQFYPMTTAQDQGAGAAMSGMMSGGENAQDYSGQFSDLRGMADKQLGQINSLSQANSILGGQINAFGGTLTGVQSQVGNVNSQVGDLNRQLAVNGQQQTAMKGQMDSMGTQMTGLNTNITGMQTGVNTLQTNDASQTAYMLRLGKALERIKEGIKV